MVRIDPRAARHQPLSDFNAAQAAADRLAAAAPLLVHSRRGKRIHNLLVLPPAFDQSKKYPLLVLMHGGPHSMWRDQFFLRWNYHLPDQPGYVVLLTNYTGSTGFGEKFAQQIQGDPLKGPAKRSTRRRTRRSSDSRSSTARARCAGGASYGGHLANWMQATTTRYRCLVSHAGLINLESQWGTSDTIFHREVGNGGPVWEQGPVWREQNPIRYAKNFRTPILLSVGENDYRVPLEPDARELERAAAAADSEPPGGVPGRESLGAEGREQPVLLRRVAGLAEEIPRLITAASRLK